MAGVVFEILYHHSAKDPIDIKTFRMDLAVKQIEAQRQLKRLKEIINNNALDSVYIQQFPKNDISYYLLNNANELLYWSDNYTDITSIPHKPEGKWHYFTSSNAHCISAYTKTKQGIFFAVIRIKNNYPFENNQLINKFSSDFDIDKQIGIEYGKSSDPWAFTDYEGTYLFTFKLPAQEISYQHYGVAGFIFQFLCLLCILIVLARFKWFFNLKELNINWFLSLLLIVSAFVFTSLYLKFPHLLYYEILSSAFDYSAGSLLASIIHLTILTAFVFSLVYLFFLDVTIGDNQHKIKSIALQIVSSLYFILIFYILKGLVLHSGMPINILSLHDFDKGVVWLHFLMLLWGISFALLFFKTHNYSIKKSGLKNAIRTDLIILVLIVLIFYIFDSKDTSRIILFLLIMSVGFYIPYFTTNKNNYYVLGVVWTFIFTIFLVESSAMLTRKKTENKYKVLAENILINGNTENDKVTEILLEELSAQLQNDTSLAILAHNPAAADSINDYLTENYLRGYWNKYNSQITVAKPASALYGQNMNLLESGVQVGTTNFFILTSSISEVSYLGCIEPKTRSIENVVLFITLTPRKNFKSYSFPNFLISSESDIQSRLKIAVARYHKGQLLYSSESYKFPEQSSFLALRKNLFYKVSVANRTFYVYKPNAEDYVIITELNQYNFVSYVLYFIYTLLFNLVVVFLFIWLINRKRNTTVPYSSLSSKYQIAFVLLLLVSFIGIFYVSVTFISSKYKEQQLAEINKKKNYIQNALQDKYYWTQDISTVNPQALNFDLQELSTIYQTDINVYDNYGKLAGSSQPLIYNKKLTGRQIAPEPYFGNNPNLNQEEYIGELQFLTGYTDFYNGDFLQIGYIAIPLYVSSEEIRNEIEDFLAVVVHIYLIIALLSVFLSFIIGKQLSAPLKLIENKLKKMRFGQRNEKIDYNQNDEIGQLVKQYNKTIEELEKSANLLAQTERESAWRTMARQIAHEINNPLTPMKLTLQQLQRTKNMNDEHFDDYFIKSTKTLVEQIDNLSRIAGTFSNFARMPEAQFERFDIASKLYLTTELFGANNEDFSIQYNGLTEKVFVIADPEQMTQVFNNLLKNSIQAIPAGRKGEIVVTLTVENKQLIISICDNGKGIPVELHDKIFIPNFTTKSTGMGLGLSITKNIVEMAGGSITFESTENIGTTFRVRLKLD